MNKINKIISEFVFILKTWFFQLQLDNIFLSSLYIFKIFYQILIQNTYIYKYFLIVHPIMNLVLNLILFILNIFSDLSYFIWTSGIFKQTYFSLYMRFKKRNSIRFCLL